MTDGRRRSVLPVVVLDAVTGGDANVDVEAAVDATTAPAAVPAVGTASLFVTVMLYAMINSNIIYHINALGSSINFKVVSFGVEQVMDCISSLLQDF